jgi:hypothetical protein
MNPTLKILFSLLAAVAFNSPLSAQHLDWVKKTGNIGTDFGLACAIDHFGNVYTVGKFYDTVDFDPGPAVFNMVGDAPSGYGVFIQKLDVSGNFIWAKQLVGETVMAMTLDTFGNIFITSNFLDTVDFDPGPATHYAASAGLFDIYVLKLDSAGNFLWVKTTGGANEEDARAIAVDNEDNVYLTGSFKGTCDFDPDPLLNFNLVSAGNMDIYVLKLDAFGNLTWAKRIGATNEDQGSSICVQNSTGAVYTTGIFKDSADFDPGPGNYYLTDSLQSGIFVVKLDAGGDFEWAKDAASSGYSDAPSISIDPVGNLRLAGNTLFNGSFIQKLDTSGTILWNTQSYIDGGYLAITTDGSGNVYATGSFSGTWDADPGTGIHNIYTAVAGESWGVFIQKLDSAGNFSWAGGMAGEYGTVSQGTAIAVDDSGNIVTTGVFNYSQDFDPGPGITTLSSAGDIDIFTCRIGVGACTLPSPPVSVTGDTSLCHGSTGVYFVTEVPGATAYSWFRGSALCWYSPDTTAFLTMNQGAVISVAAYNSCGGSDTVSLLSVVVHPLPNTVITVSGNILSVDTGFFSYQWYRNGTLLAGADSASYAAIQGGLYKVEVTDSNGCSKTFAYHILTGVSSLPGTADGIKVYPNPAADFITIETGKVGKFDYVICGLDGRLLLSGSINGPSSTIDLSGILPGIYLLRVEGAVIRLVKR